VAWARNYWDTFHHLFWAPEFLGLDPIKKEFVKTLDPRFLNGSSIRYRSRNWEEETVSGRRQNLGLLYIAPEALVAEIGRKFSQWERPLDWNIIRTHPEAQTLNRHIREIIGSDEAHFADVVGHLSLEPISWSYLYRKACELRGRLDPANPKEQTLYRLLDGFLEQLTEHHATGITAS
jgi:hypothetical protein